MSIKILNKLSVKLIISISLILIIILSFNTYIAVKNIKNYLTDASFQNAYNLSDVIKKSIRYSMLLNRREDVIQIIKTIGTEKGVKGIRIYNKQGLIIFSTDSSEILKQVNMTAEACMGCHSKAKPLVNLTAQKKMRIFNDAENIKVLGVINPIHNEADCSTANCHAHYQKVEVLGVLDVMISLKNLDNIISQNTGTLITNSIILMLFISFFCGLFITILVNKPVKKLTKGIDEIGRGNLKYKIPVTSNSELDQVALKFNEMSDKLEAAYKEIEDWSENLNKKVQEKSDELKNIYEQVMQIEKLASLGKLSATVAHELNNPLEGILTYSKLIHKMLKEHPESKEFEKLIEYLELISGESSRCGRIVKDLLLFSHKDDDKYLKTDLVQLLDKCIKLISHHLEMNKIMLLKEYTHPLLESFCNPQEIQQAFMSLLINAIEAMPNGGKITVKLEMEKNSAVIRITDEGIGISEKDLSHIFEPFYTTKEASRGTGLGLAIAYGIFNHHNGYVEVEKTSYLGTTFKITLPINETNS